MQIRSFLKKEFVKNVATLSSGSIISQIIIYISILLLTRLFTSEAFGVYILFTSLLFVLKPISTLQYEFTVVLPKNRKEAVNLFAFTLLVLVIICSILFFLITTFKEEIITLFSLEKLSFFIYLLPFALLILGGISALEKWNNRLNDYKKIANGQVVKAIGTSGTQIFTGLSFFSKVGLIPGLFFGYLSHITFLTFTSFQSLKKEAIYVSFSDMFFLAKKYIDVPKFNTVISFFSSLSNELPVLFLSPFFGLSSAGFYGLATKFIKAPVGALQQSVYQVFYNKASITYQNKAEELNALLVKTIKNLFYTGLLVFMPLFILSYFLDIIFGSDWGKVGAYARALLPWLFVSFLNQPISSLSIILNKQKVVLYIVVIFIFLRFGGLYLGYTIYADALTSVTFFSIISAFFSFTVLLYLLNASKNPKKAYV